MEHRCPRDWLRGRRSHGRHLDPKPGLWKAFTVNALAASIWASVPLLHRFGTLWGALTSTLTLYALLFVVTYLFGTGTGLQTGYFVAAACTVVFLGTERILLSAVLCVLAALLVVVLQITVPYNTGLLDSATLFANFVATVFVTVILLMMIVTFALSEAAPHRPSPWANLPHPPWRTEPVRLLSFRPMS